MKTLKKLHLRNVSEFLSNKEMRLVVGGYEDNEYFRNPLCINCQDDEYCDWYFLRCMPKPTSTPKIDACAGSKEGDPCSFIDEGGVRRYGRCTGRLAPSYSMHCSDLI